MNISQYLGRSLTYPSFLVLLILLAQPIYAQEQLGLRLDNYAGINGVVTQPTAMASFPLKWDLNLGSIGFFGDNNMFFVENSSISTLAGKKTIGADPALNYFTNKGVYDVYYDFYDGLQARFGALNVSVMGPSLGVHLGDRHSISIFSQARLSGSTHDFPGVLNSYAYDRKQLEERFDLPAFKGAVMAWGELGLNYAYKFGDKENGLVVGVTAKMLFGGQGFYVNNYDGTTVTKISKDTLLVNRMNAEVGFTSTFMTNPSSLNGTGVGFDFGLTYINGDEYADYYNYKVSFSVLDIGQINMVNSAETYRLNLKTPTILAKVDYKLLNKDNPIRDAIGRFSTMATGNSNSALVGNAFGIYLPTAVNFQLDYGFSKSLYLNLFLLQRATLGDIGLERDNVLALSPRFESRWFGVSVPVSLLNYEYTRVGLAGRVAFLSFGTDNLFSLVGKGQFTGVDFYLALKFNPFKIGGGSSSSRKGKSRVNCYNF
jgi:Family of unknown function (DUF5723)